jgi:lysophospholipase L1-like esterase
MFHLNNKSVSSFILILVYTCFTIQAQRYSFKNNDRIAFIGNSITQDGGFHHNIMQYFIGQYPSKPINFINCGISGDVVVGIIDRLDSDILIHKPTHAYVMIGMNDVQRQLYGPTITQNADTLALRAKALKNYHKDLTTLLYLLKKEKIKVTLQKPSIYDQTAILPQANHLGVNDALKTCADFMEELANSQGIPTIDYWGSMSKQNAELQKQNPSATVVSPDRIHPDANGHLFMAAQWFWEENFPNIVSSVSIAKNSFKVENAKLSKFKNEGSIISFNLLEKSIPFATTSEQANASKWLDFPNKFNQQLIQFNALEAGDYSLYIDSALVGVFTHSQLNEGVNLSTNTNTPQYKQAVQVRQTLENYWALEADTRTIAWAETKHLMDCTANGTIEQLKTCLDKRFDAYFTNSPYKTYIREQYNKYLSIKPKQAYYSTQMKALRSLAYKQAAPLKHHYKLLKN